MILDSCFTLRLYFSFICAKPSGFTGTLMGHGSCMGHEWSEVVHGVVKLIIYWHRYSDFAVWPMHCVPVSHYPVSELGSTTTVPTCHAMASGLWPSHSLGIPGGMWHHASTLAGKGRGGVNLTVSIPVILLLLSARVQYCRFGQAM